MTSERVRAAFAWIWLPGMTEPVVCGKIEDRGGFHEFIYGQSYRKRKAAMALDHLELPLGAEVHRSRHLIHGVIRDAAPDAWGRRVVEHQLGMAAARADAELGELDYLLGAGGDRVGALHFQESADAYCAPARVEADLADLAQAAQLLEKNAPLPPALAAALLHGTTIGGARPKALLADGDHRRLIAKFSSTTDLWPVVRCEFLGMRLAADIGLDVAPVELVRVEGRDVLLVERFDRVATADGLARRHFFSALTALGLPEEQGRYASYLELADFLVKYSANAQADCRELYRRMVYNIVVGNTDDHARNHAVFWDGTRCRLTPAYDVTVYRRVGQVASQSIAVGAQGNASTLGNALSGCERFGLDRDAAKAIQEEICARVAERWRAVAEEAGLAATFVRQLGETAILSAAVREP